MKNHLNYTPKEFFMILVRARVQTVTQYARLRKSAPDLGLPVNPVQIWPEMDTLDVLCGKVGYQGGMAISLFWRDNLELFLPFLQFSTAYCMPFPFALFAQWDRGMRAGWRERMSEDYCNALSEYVDPTPDFIEFLETDLAQAVRDVEPFPWKKWSPHKAELTQELCYRMIADIWPDREKYRPRR